MPCPRALSWRSPAAPVCPSQITDADQLYEYLQGEWPQIEWREALERQYAEEFVKTTPVRFPTVSYTTKLSTTFDAPEAAPLGRQCGVALVGDALHAFPPDLGQGMRVRRTPSPSARRLGVRTDACSRAGAWDASVVAPSRNARTVAPRDVPDQLTTSWGHSFDCRSIAVSPGAPSVSLRLQNGGSPLLFSRRSSGGSSAAAWGCGVQRSWGWRWAGLCLEGRGVSPSVPPSPSALQPFRNRQELPPNRFSNGQ